MRNFRNNPGAFKELRKQILAKTIPMMGVIVAGALAISYFTHDGFTEGLPVVLGYTVFIVVVLTFSVFRTIKQQETVFNSFDLIIGPDYLLRRQQGLPDKTIHFNEIDCITETEKGFLGVKAGRADNTIFIAPYLEGYDEARGLLQQVMPFTLQQKTNILAKYPLLMALVVCALMAAVYASKNKAVVTICGVLLIAGMIWSFFKTRASTLIDKRVKRSLWLVWIVILSIALAIYYKAFGGLQP